MPLYTSDMPKLPLFSSLDSKSEPTVHEECVHTTLIILSNMLYLDSEPTVQSIHLVV